MAPFSWLAAVLRHGFWDDPASALGGPIAASVSTQVKQKNLPDRITPYLAWRYAAMICGGAIWLAKLVYAVPDLSGGNLRRFLQLVPGEYRESDFDALVQLIVATDVAFYVCSIAAFLLFVASTACYISR